jgi:hypothetical protein
VDFARVQCTPEKSIKNEMDFQNVPHGPHGLELCTAWTCIIYRMDLNYVPHAHLNCLYARSKNIYSCIEIVNIRIPSISIVKIIIVNVRSQKEASRKDIHACSAGLYATPALLARVERRVGCNGPGFAVEPDASLAYK